MGDRIDWNWQLSQIAVSSYRTGDQAALLQTWRRNTMCLVYLDGLIYIGREQSHIMQVILRAGLYSTWLNLTLHLSAIGCHPLPGRRQLSYWLAGRVAAAPGRVHQRKVEGVVQHSRHCVCCGNTEEYFFLSHKIWIKIKNVFAFCFMFSCQSWRFKVQQNLNKTPN